MSSTKLSARWKRRFGALRNAPLALCCVTLSVSLEAFAAYGILEQSHGPVGYLEAMLCISCGLASLVVSANATEMKRDPRAIVRRGAYGARLVALFLLIPSTFYVGQSFAYQAQMAEWREFHGSAEEAALTQLAAGVGSNGEYIDSQARLQATADLARGQRPERASFDPLSTLWAGLILTLNMLAIGIGRRPKPETEAEAKRRVKLASIAKARATRAANKAAEAKLNRFDGVPNVREMLRTGKANQA